MIRIFFGSPGCGKTTLACRNFHALQRKNQYRYYFANFENSLSTYVSLDSLGSWSFPRGSLLVVDESGIEFNNRKYKLMSQSLISYLKLHRHFGVDIDFISQSWEDMDITIRRLADELWYVRKVGSFTFGRRIYKRCGIDSVSHQIIDEYRFGRFIWGCLPPPFYSREWFVFWRKPYYHYFDSYSTPAGVVVPRSLSSLPERHTVSNWAWLTHSIQRFFVNFYSKFGKKFRNKFFSSSKKIDKK